MRERLQKILSAKGVASRRRAEEMIAAGRVTCNGVVCSVGDCADEQIDEILLDGKPLPSGDKNVYILLNKPRGYVTTLSDEKGRKNVAQLVSDCGQRVYPVGRLDMDSEGLLILTNDGAFANQVMHPKHEIKKVYCVTVTKYTDEALRKLGRPITLDGYTISKPEVALIKKFSGNNFKAELLVAIHEGRNRQVRRMCAAAGMNVVRLVRISEGALKLGDLQAGKWRYLTDEEVASLKK